MKALALLSKRLNVPMSELLIVLPEMAGGQDLARGLGQRGRVETCERCAGNRRPAGGGTARHGVHLEVVAEEDAAKAEPVPEEVGADDVR